MNDNYVVIVAYNPIIEDLDKVCNIVNLQGSKLIIVDNSLCDFNLSLLEQKYENTEVISMRANTGVAHAMNEGMKLVISRKARCVTFLDQDSNINQDDLTNLQKQSYLLNSVVGPVAINKENGKEYPAFRINKWGLTEEIYVSQETKPILVDLIITSGTTVSIENFKKIGMFDEDFFIDFVDLEWCVRCKKLGISMYVIPDVRLEHFIGKTNQKVVGISLNIHSAERTYYKVRNSFLIRKKCKMRLFGISQIMPALIHNLLEIVVVNNKKEYWHFYIKGIIDGIKGKKGQYEE